MPLGRPPSSVGRRSSALATPNDGWLSSTAFRLVLLPLAWREGLSIHYEGLKIDRAATSKVRPQPLHSLLGMARDARKPFERHSARGRARRWGRLDRHPTTPIRMPSLYFKRTSIQLPTRIGLPRYDCGDNDIRAPTFFVVHPLWPVDAPPGNEKDSSARRNLHS